MDRRSERRTRRNSLIIATLVTVGCLPLAAPNRVEAAENGIGLYLLGSRGRLAGYLPPPGLYVESDTFYYDGKLGGNARLPTGGEVIANVYQITGDSGPGARLGDFEGRVTALSGTIAYNFELGHTPVSTRLKVSASSTSKTISKARRDFSPSPSPLR